MSTTALVGAHPASSTARGSRHETTADTPLPIITTPYWESILDDHRERVADLLHMRFRLGSSSSEAGSVLAGDDEEQFGRRESNPSRAGLSP